MKLLRSSPQSLGVSVLPHCREVLADKIRLCAPCQHVRIHHLITRIAESACIRLETPSACIRVVILSSEPEIFLLHAAALLRNDLQILFKLSRCQRSPRQTKAKCLREMSSLGQVMRWR